MLYSSSVVNPVANAAAVVAQQLVAERFRRQRRCTNRGSAPGRHFLKRLGRSVREVYQELGEVYFRRAYRMKFGTFQRLASILRPYIIAASGKETGQGTTSQMDESCQKFDLPVPCIGLLGGRCTTS